MHEDLFERSFRDVYSKYRLMHGLPEREEPQLNNSTPGIVGAPSLQALPSLEETKKALKLSGSRQAKQAYSRDQLIDLAERSAAPASYEQILGSIVALNLDREPDQAAPQPKAQQRTASNGIPKPEKGGPGRSKAAREAAASAVPPQTTSTQPTQFAPDLKEALQQPDQTHVPQPAEGQQAGQEEEQQPYSEADWNAYWQYYGYSVPPPPAPPQNPPQLCSSHIAQLQQLLAAQSGSTPASLQPQPEDAHVQSSQTPRQALQSRADQLQAGKLTALLMSWFDAGYQMGKLEAQVNATLQ